MLHQVLQVLILVSCLLVEVLWFHRYLSYFHYFHNFLTLIFFWLLSASPFSSKLVFLGTSINYHPPPPQIQKKITTSREMFQNTLNSFNFMQFWVKSRLFSLFFPPPPIYYTTPHLPKLRNLAGERPPPA